MSDRRNLPCDPVEWELIGLFRQLDNTLRKGVLDVCRGGVRQLRARAEGLKPTPAHRAATDKQFQAFLARCRDT